MDADVARARARELFLATDNLYGCAETACIVLTEAYGLPADAARGASMALNGGIAYSGGTCGAITGAALAVGMLEERRHGDHREAKRAAREVVAETMREFEATFGATTCRALTGVDLSTEEGHRAFVASGAWREGCMRQIEHVVGRLADDAWLSRRRP